MINPPFSLWVVADGDLTQVWLFAIHCMFVLTLPGI